MGAVWRADHLTLNAPVAVKLLDSSIAATEEGLARFLREAQAAAALRGSHVVQTFDYGVSESVPFIVMELLVGDSLGDRLARHGPLAPRAVASLLKQVGRAVGKAHQEGIIHRDLKPDNIFLVDSDGDDFTAKVLDFGIAKATSILGVSTGSKTRTGALLGTPYYMSPEQAQGIKEVDFRTDLWALAVITFECVTGKRPFESEALGDLLLKICASPMPVPSQVATVPPGFDEWFAKAANRDREQRFSSAGEMARAFQGLLDPSTLSGDSYTSLLPSSRAAPVFRAKPTGDSLEGTLMAGGSARTNGRNVVWIATGATLAGLAVILGIFATGKGHDGAHAAASAAPARALTPPPPPLAEPPAPIVEPSAPALEASAASVRPPAPARHVVAKAAAPKHSGAPAPAPPASEPKKQEPFDPLQMRR
jgi:serine/threonine protein kinase